MQGVPASVIVLNPLDRQALQAMFGEHRGVCRFHYVSPAALARRAPSRPLGGLQPMMAPLFNRVGRAWSGCAKPSRR